MKVSAICCRLSHLLEWHRLRELVNMRARSDRCQSGPIRLYYPRASWYAENAQEMLGILGEAGTRLEQALGLRLPLTSCYVVEPETAVAIQGTTGAAYRRSVIIGFPERHL